MVVAPGAIAFLLTKRFESMLLVAIAVALGSTLTGIYASFLIDSAPAPTIVLVMTAIFILTFVKTMLAGRGRTAST
ncbi:MAG: metal ABC transporter permease, partial [Pseudomonadota bacterium]|nr:metal ABC transporter permease [Pseudomonadota bacterium]